MTCQIGKLQNCVAFFSFIQYHACGMFYPKSTLIILLLVEAIYLLPQESISIGDLSKSSILLKKFCIQIRPLYGARYQTYNIHSLIHLVWSVYNLGNLWAVSAFYYEDYNGDLKNLFHGTQGVDIQIVTAVCIHQKMPELVTSFIPGSKAVELYTRMSQSYHHSVSENQLEYIDESTCAVGKMEVSEFPSEIRKKLVEKLAGKLHKCFKFKRLLQKTLFTILLSIPKKPVGTALQYRTKEGMAPPPTDMSSSILNVSRSAP